MGELGLGAQARDYLTLSGGASSTWIVPLGRHRATAGVELRGDRFRDRDANATRAALIGDRDRRRGARGGRSRRAIPMR